MQGHRVYPDAEGWFLLEEGDYTFDTRSGHWFARAPSCEFHGDLSNHTITEHSDGTITVSPSILYTEHQGQATEKKWHGYLENGVWREV
jgi:hypothetical protein